MTPQSSGQPRPCCYYLKRNQSPFLKLNPQCGKAYCFVLLVQLPLLWCPLQTFAVPHSALNDTDKSHSFAFLEFSQGAVCACVLKPHWQDYYLRNIHVLITDIFFSKSICLLMLVFFDLNSHPKYQGQIFKLGFCGQIKENVGYQVLLSTTNLYYQIMFKKPIVSPWTTWTNQLSEL